MGKKFYQTKEFLKIENEWYDKLKESGFDDIEWYDPKTGIGRGGAMMGTKTNRNLQQLRKTYSPALQQHYRLCRNFAANGPFYSILKEKYNKIKDLAALELQSRADLSSSSQFSHAVVSEEPGEASLNQFLSYYKVNLEDLRSFYKFCQAIEPYFPKCDEVLWNMYSEGGTIRDISSELRRLYRYKRLGKPPKRFRTGKKSHTWGKSAKGLPYSTYWVKHRIDYLRLEMLQFNLSDSEGIDPFDYDDPRHMP